MFAEENLEASAIEVAVTAKLPAAAPAVYIPALEIVPPVAVQATAVFEEPVTIAANVCCAPGCMVTLAGDTET